jgi:hypothetical protein
MDHNLSGHAHAAWHVVQLRLGSQVKSPKRQWHTFLTSTFPFTWLRLGEGALSLCRTRPQLHAAATTIPTVQPSERDVCRAGMLYVKRRVCPLAAMV